MENKKITITIKKDGEVSAEAHGFKGKSCESAMDFLHKMGRIKNSKKKPEYWDPGSPSINVSTIK